MSHFKERKEKNCLNCNAEIHGRYCHICGQENREPTESFWQLVTHFFHDLTHFDGKFFSTLRLLVLKPGFLSTEYKVGRRASYLNPIKMYIFTSAVFFFIFFSFFKIDEKTAGFKMKTNLEDSALIKDSAAFSRFTQSINDGKPMSRQEYRVHVDSLKKRGGVHLTGTSYKTKAEYDSVLKAGKKNHNWLQRQLIYKEIEINEKFQNDTGKFGAALVSNIVHSFPQMFFLSLPLFALFLKWLYIRHKQFYYVSHMIFTFHLYIFVFIVLLFIFAITQVQQNFDVPWLNWIIALLYMFIFFYEYKAMRNFYGQRRAKTILKYILLNSWLLFIILVLFIVFLFFSFLKV